MLANYAWIDCDTLFASRVHHVPDKTTAASAATVAVYLVRAVFMLCCSMLLVGSNPTILLLRIICGRPFILALAAQE